MVHLKCKFDNGEFALLAELQPPKWTDISRMVANIQPVRDKVDAFVVTDMCNAMLHMSALSSAMLLQSRGVETVMQVCVRDRNRLALQADLLGANACGIINLLAVTGEDPIFGDHQQADLEQCLGMVGLAREDAPQRVADRRAEPPLERLGREREGVVAVRNEDFGELLNGRLYLEIYTRESPREGTRGQIRRRYRRWR